MKRSERFFLKARHKAWTSLAILAVSLTAGVWVPAAFLSGGQPGGALAAAAAGALFLFGLWVAGLLASEAVRLARRGAIEDRWETEREIRPRL